MRHLECDTSNIRKRHYKSFKKTPNNLKQLLEQQENKMGELALALDRVFPPSKREQSDINIVSLPQNRLQSETITISSKGRSNSALKGPKHKILPRFELMKGREQFPLHPEGMRKTQKEK